MAEVDTSFYPQANPNGLLDTTGKFLGVAGQAQGVQQQHIDLVPSTVDSLVADFSARGTRITRLILTATALTEDARPESILIRARKLGLAVSKLPALDQGGI